MLALVGAPTAGAAAPAAIEVQMSGVGTGSCTLEGAGARGSGGGSGSTTMSVIFRQPLRSKGWYWSYGAQAENYFFGGESSPRRLQDYAALLSLEYYRDTESVAALNVRPGWYFENHPVARAWDAPVDLVSGIPVTGDFSGVVGFSNGRFYHHALPILGFVWTAGPRIRLEAVYPQPALIVTFNPATTLRLGGELSGAGFLSSSPRGPAVVEYVSYRVGTALSRAWPPGWRLTAGVGVEAVRSFDFFRAGRRLHGGGAGYLNLSAVWSR